MSELNLVPQRLAGMSYLRLCAISAIVWWAQFIFWQVCVVAGIIVISGSSFRPR